MAIWDLLAQTTADPLAASKAWAQVIKFWLDFGAGLLLHPLVTFLLGGTVVGSASESARAGMVSGLKKLNLKKKHDEN